MKSGASAAASRHGAGTYNAIIALRCFCVWLLLSISYWFSSFQLHVPLEMHTSGHAVTQPSEAKTHSFSSSLHLKHPISSCTWPPASNQSGGAVSMAASNEQIQMQIGGQGWWIKERWTLCADDKQIWVRSVICEIRWLQLNVEIRY